MRIDLHHPTLPPIGIKLLVPGRVKRVGEVDAPAVATDLDHLWAAVERLLGLVRVRRAPDNATDVNRSRLLRIGRVGDVALDELPGPPARNIEEAVVE